MGWTMRLRALMNLRIISEINNMRIRSGKTRGCIATGNQITIIITADEWIKYRGREVVQEIGSEEGKCDFRFLWLELPFGASLPPPCSFASETSQDKIDCSKYPSESGVWQGSPAAEKRDLSLAYDRTGDHSSSADVDQETKSSRGETYISIFLSNPIFKGRIHVPSSTHVFFPMPRTESLACMI